MRIARRQKYAASSTASALTLLLALGCTSPSEEPMDANVELDARAAPDSATADGALDSATDQALVTDASIDAAADRGSATADAALDAGAPSDDYLGGREPIPGELRVAPLRRASIPEGMASVAVGVGDGRIVTLCNRGRTIAADNVYEPGADDHDPYSAKGITFANGWFFHSTGHGAPGFLLRSRDGLEWEELAGEHFHYADGSTGDLPGGTATVFFADERFVLSLGRRRLFSDDGLDWFEEAEELDRFHFHYRSNRYIRGLGAHFQGGENAPKTERWLIRSDDEGATYRILDAATCSAPSFFAHGVLLSGSTEAHGCLSLDGGESWSALDTSLAESPGGYLAVDDGFLAFRGQRRSFFHSPDLENWTEIEIRELRFASAGRAPDGYYVMTSRREPEFYRSDDGMHWESMASSTEHSSIRRWAFGYAPPSERCPAD